MKCVASCAFGIEAVLKRELQDLEYTITDSENGRIYFETDQEGLMRANMALRTADRIFMVLGHQRVTTFDALFDFVTSLTLGKYVSAKGRYLIDAKSVKSALFSLRDVQSITKKALIEHLKTFYNQNQFLEQGERYHFLMNIQADVAELWLDTSGDALHKRGYRSAQGEAPIKETLAAAMILLSFYQQNRVLYDPFCGSGTIPIEAAMIAKRMAPNLNRTFDFQQFYWIDKLLIRKVRAHLLKAIDQDAVVSIIASDSDRHMIEMASENAINAGVDDCIQFKLCAFEHMSFDEPYGVIITNPPYGERLQTTKEAEALYHSVSHVVNTLKTFSVYLITSYPGIEGIFGRKATRTRVLFNGNIKARYYQFIGPRPQ